MRDFLPKGFLGRALETRVPTKALGGGCRPRAWLPSARLHVVQLAETAAVLARRSEGEGLLRLAVDFRERCKGLMGFRRQG